MAYGFRISNNLGVPVFDDTLPCLRVLSSGTTQNFNAAVSAVVAEYDALPTPKYLHRLNYGGLGASFRGPGPTTTTAPSFYLKHLGYLDGQTQPTPTYMPHPLFGINSGGFSAFYQWTNLPINRSLECEFDHTAMDGGTLCSVSGARPFKLVGKFDSGQSYSENYAMRIRDAAGELLFDSRAEYLSVRYAFIVPKAKVEDVLFNGATVDVTLPEAMPNSWVSLPLMYAFNYQLHARRFYEGGNRRIDTVSFDVVQMQQINNTTLRVNRNTGNHYEVDQPSYIDPGPYYNYTHDIVAYLARNPA